jgi:hypothetical protein
MIPMYGDNGGTECFQEMSAFTVCAKILPPKYIKYVTNKKNILSPDCFQHI